MISSPLYADTIHHFHHPPSTHHRDPAYPRTLYTMSTSTTDRIASVESTLTNVIGQLEQEANLKKQIREALEPIEEVARAAVTEMNKLHSAPASERE